VTLATAAAEKYMQLVKNMNLSLFLYHCMTFSVVTILLVVSCETSLQLILRIALAAQNTTEYNCYLTDTKQNCTTASYIVG
jgi:hypothetical protein